MLVFIDESGIHKKIDHSSFAVVFVEVENEILVNLGIKSIEQDLGIVNFHWSDFGSKAGWLIRQKFIKNAIKLPFCFKYAIVDNPVRAQESLFNCLVELLKGEDIKNVLIDGRQPRWYARQIKRSLRGRGISIKKLRLADDRAVPCLRLADAMAGLVRSYHDNASVYAQELYNLIKSKLK